MKSYEASREHADLDSEVERLRAQVRLSWNGESRALEAFGLRDGMSIVDLGSGPGFTLARLLASHPSSQITGVELDPALHALAQANLEASPRLALLNRSALDTGLADDSVDFVIARFLYQHLEDPVFAAKEAHRILKPGGRLVVIDVDESVWGLTDPPILEMQQVMGRYAAVHASMGRDRRIGRKLWRILGNSGFEALESFAAIAHSDEVGLSAFNAQLDLGRLTGLVQAGAFSAVELESARAARDRFLGSPDSIMMTLTLMVSGRKPGA